MPPNAILSIHLRMKKSVSVESLAAMYGQSALFQHLHDDFVRHVPLQFLEGQAYAVLHARLFADHTFLA